MNRNKSEEGPTSGFAMAYQATTLPQSPQPPAPLPPAPYRKSFHPPEFAYVLSKEKTGSSREIECCVVTAIEIENMTIRV